MDREAAIELSNEWYDVVRGDEALSVQSNSRAAALARLLPTTIRRAVPQSSTAIRVAETQRRGIAGSCLARALGNTHEPGERRRRLGRATSARLR